MQFLTCATAERDDSVIARCAKQNDTTFGALGTSFGIATPREGATILPRDTERSTKNTSSDSHCTAEVLLFDGFSLPKLISFFFSIFSVTLTWLIHPGAICYFTWREEEGLFFGASPLREQEVSSPMVIGGAAFLSPTFSNSMYCFYFM